MTKPNAPGLYDIMDAVFDIQAALILMSKRLSAVGDQGGPDDKEIYNMSRVADLCVRSLDNVAESIELVETDTRTAA